MPTDTSRLSDAIYRQHCTEIINRALGGLDTRPGTDAECLAALSSASLKSPLKHAYVVAMEKLFSRVFPGTDLGQRLTDDAPTETDEIIADLRRELLVPSRKA